MLTVAIDCALAPASVAIDRDGTTLGIWRQDADNRSSDAMVMGLRNLARQHGVQLAEIDRIVVTVGPGGFTALRVGLSLAQGLQLASGAAAYAVSSLQAIALTYVAEDVDRSAAKPALSGPNPNPGDGGDLAEIAIRVLADARRGQVFLQDFNKFAAQISECEVLPVEEARARNIASPAETLVMPPVDEHIINLVSGPDVATKRCGILSCASVLAAAISNLGLAPVEKIRPIYLKEPDAAPQRQEFVRSAQTLRSD